MESYAELQEVIIRGQRLLAHRDDPQLAQLVGGLQVALAPLAARVADVQVGADWLARISTILSVAAEPAPTAAGAAQHLQICLEQLEQEVVAPDLVAFRQHLQKVSRSYWPGLFHCYDHPDIPRTNNGKPLPRHPTAHPADHGPKRADTAHSPSPGGVGGAGASPDGSRLSVRTTPDCPNRPGR